MPTARCTNGSGGSAIGGMQLASLLCVSAPEPMTLMKSMSPVSDIACAISLAISWSMPLSLNSSAHILRPTQKSLPTASRTASSTSMPKRIRFSSEPPYSSLRRFVSGDQN
jgi:hypothetical protein